MAVKKTSSKQSAKKKAPAKKAPAKAVKRPAPKKGASTKKPAPAPKKTAAPKKTSAVKAVAGKKPSAPKSPPAPQKAAAHRKPAAPKPPVAAARAEAPKKASAEPKAPAPKKPKKSGGAASVAGSVFGQAKDVRILVVDDEPEVLELLVPFLRGKGYTVSEAQDGDQALEKILTERPNIVVLDVMMPGLSGWEISRYVRERAELDPVRIIMATGIGKETNAATSPLYGADAYLDKPFRLDALDRTVAEVIKRIESTAF